MSRYEGEINPFPDMKIETTQEELTRLRAENAELKELLCSAHCIAGVLLLACVSIE
jgi:hypothetical protein